MFQHTPSHQHQPGAGNYLSSNRNVRKKKDQTKFVHPFPASESIRKTKQVYSNNNNKNICKLFFTDNFNSLSPLFFLSNVHFQSIIFVKYILPYTTSLCCFFANIFVVVDILRQRCETQSNRVEGNKQRRLEENELFEIYTNNKQKQKALLRYRAILVQDI